MEKLIWSFDLRNGTVYTPYMHSLVISKDVISLFLIAYPLQAAPFAIIHLKFRDGKQQRLLSAGTNPQDKRITQRTYVRSLMDMAKILLTLNLSQF